VRDDYGLALSSRNAYLSNTELKTARLLNVVMHHLADEIREFPFEVGDLIPSGIRTLLDAGFDQIDYLELCDATTLEPMIAWNLKPARLLVAGWVGRTRLLDNVAV
jgi:pantoate--beta-alanine ligase